MWHGAFTSLVPVQILGNGAILWHFEASDNDDVLQLKDIGALQGLWFRSMDLGVHYSAPAIMGYAKTGRGDAHCHRSFLVQILPDKETD